MQFYWKKWAGITIGNNCCVKKMTENHQKLYEPATLHTYSVYIMSVTIFFLPHLTQRAMWDIIDEFPVPRHYKGSKPFPYFFFFTKENIGCHRSKVIVLLTSLGQSAQNTKLKICLHVLLSLGTRPRHCHRHPSYVINLYKDQLLWNYWANWNQTW